MIGGKVIKKDDGGPAFEVTAEQLRQVDSVRSTLYMLSLEPDVPQKILEEQVCLASRKLYQWLLQFKPDEVFGKHTYRNGVEHEWPDNYLDLWDAHK